MDPQRIEYSDGTTRLTGVLVAAQSPAASARSVMIVHGGAGLDAHAQEQAHRFAALGYVAFACDMYGEGVPGNRDRIMATIGELRSNRSLLHRRAQAGLRVLAGQPGVEPPVAIVGYCLGGLVALETARAGEELAAVVSVHGTLATAAPAAPDSINAPVLACHGALDPHCPWTDVTAFANEMTAAKATWQFVAYGNALHGFTHKTATGQTPGVRYDATADRQSFDAICMFLADAFARV